MNRSRRFSRTASMMAAGAALVLLAGGCTRIRDHKGFVSEQALVDGIQAGIDNRESVERTLGRPTFASQFDPNVWYYFGRNTKQLAFRNATPVQQEMLEIKFDQAGNVASVRKAGMEQVARIDPEGDKTPTLGRERGFFQELFGNIGSVGAVGQGGGTADNPN